MIKTTIGFMSESFKDIWSWILGGILFLVLSLYTYSQLTFIEVEYVNAPITAYESGKFTLCGNVKYNFDDTMIQVHKWAYTIDGDNAEHTVPLPSINAVRDAGTTLRCTEYIVPNRMWAGHWTIRSWVTRTLWGWKVSSVLLPEVSIEILEKKE